MTDSLLPRLQAPLRRPSASAAKKSGTRSSSSSSVVAAAFLAQEEEYKRVNAALEAKTAELVRQAEEVMKGQQEMLSRPISAQIELFDEEAKHQRDLHSPEMPTLPLALNKQPNKKKSSSVTAAQTGLQSGKKGKRSLSSAKLRPHDVPSAADVAVPDFCLAKTIGKIEGQLKEGNLPDLEDDLLPAAGSEMGAEAQIRFLKAKLRVMQEELDAMGQECGKKDDENRNLTSRLKEVEEERGRLQRTAGLQQSQTEKYKTLSEEANRKSDGLQQKLSMLEKELENLKRAQKQASASQGTMEVRLNRALEEAERYKLELNKLKQSNKMHIESAKMLSFTEEEFMKALEWGNS
ncbi:testis-expressed protein 9 isoform X2 [Elgaria multicarinata webbii]|uniref:testis-expressed protein 9 isoform X2 n=1 Tax=Elgaria multicarinata webbii TaxID=159646 RepID=UPI002FCCB942